MEEEEMYWYLYLKNWLADLSEKEEGQDLGEYALLFGLIALVVIVGVTLFGTNLLARFNSWAAQIATWGS
jgi:pilus assembly protein Flp/PilA